MINLQAEHNDAILALTEQRETLKHAHHEQTMKLAAEHNTGWCDVACITHITHITHINPPRGSSPQLFSSTTQHPNALSSTNLSHLSHFPPPTSPLSLFPQRYLN